MTETMQAPATRHSHHPRPELTRRRYGPSRLLRILAGVDEAVLDWVPEERAKLTRTGAIVLCTALIAAVSVWIVLHEIIGVPVAPAIAGAVFWGGVIAVIDSWLITSTNGVIGRRRFWMLLPRLAIALLIGVLISEPVILQIFESAVTQQVVKDRAVEISTLENGYARCHQGLGATPPSGTDCDSYQLSIPVVDNKSSLATMVALRDARAEEVKEAKRRADQIYDDMNKECDGGQGDGFSGIPGDGRLCNSRRIAATKARAALNKEENELNKLGQSVSDLTSAQAKAAGSYGEVVKKAVDAKVAEIKQGWAANPGLLERLAGLGRLIAANWAIFWAHLLLTLLLVVIDSFPVLTKLFSGPNAYDRRLATQLESRERLHDHDVKVTERFRTGDNEVRLHKEEIRIRHEKADSDHEVALNAAKRDADLRAQIDTLADQVKAGRRAQGW